MSAAHTEDEMPHTQLDTQPLPRRRFIRTVAGVAMLAALGTRPRTLDAAEAPHRTLRRLRDPASRAIDFVIDHRGVNFTGARREGIAVNDSLPGPLLRLREGEDVTIRVTNRMKEDTSIHWHGLLVPTGMDGVPGLSFPGIRPGETFTYLYRVKQSGTYWYHSHSGGQEPKGLYGPLIIDPAGADPVRAERDYVVMLSEWSDEEPDEIMGNLKKESDYYNFSRPTLLGFFRNLFDPPKGATRSSIVNERLMWAKMRMQRSDISDVSHFTFLLNGKTSSQNWTGLFARGERVRLRFINASSMTYFDVKVPGLRMTVVQADGQDVEPVVVDQIRMGVAETYDVIVEPRAGQAYTIFAQAMDRTGYARGTLAERVGASAPVPAMDPRPVRTMADMGGMSGMGMGDMDMGGAQHSQPKGEHAKSDSASTKPPMTEMPMGDMPGMPGMSKDSMEVDSVRHDSVAARGAGRDSTKQAMDMGNMDMENMDMEHMAMSDSAMMHDMAMPGMAMGTMPQSNAPLPKMLESAGLPDTPGWRTLRYSDLRARTPNADLRPPEREVVLHLTGDMERYFWTINGKKLSEASPIQLRQGERVKLTYINETMMDHPMHLHGVFMELQNGAEPAYAPRKHTVSVPPAETLVTHLTADEPGTWALHCHLLYHMMTGMFTRVVITPESGVVNGARDGAA